MSDINQSEMVEKGDFKGAMQKTTNRLSKLMPKLPENIPAEDFEKLFDTVCKFLKKYDLTVSEAEQVIWHLKNTFDKLKYEQKFNW